jgi:hypothetical protein
MARRAGSTLMCGSGLSVLPEVREEKGAVYDNWRDFNTEDTECTEKKKRRAEAGLHADSFVG